MTTDQESAVRSYLTYLSDPTSLVDTQKIAKLQAEANSATDPIAKLKVLSDLDRAQSVDASAVRGDFIIHARKWAAANGVTAEAFRSMNVPADVLSAAGLDGKNGRKKAKVSRAGGTRAPGVKSEGIRAAVSAKTGTFTIREITDTTGATTATVTKVIVAMVESGALKEVGPLTNHNARGRAPMQYAKK